VQLEKEAKEVEQFYQSTDNQKNDCKNKGRENAPSGSKKPLQRASQETQAELMCHFSKLACEASASTSAIYFLLILLLLLLLLLLFDYFRRVNFQRKKLISN